MTKTKIKKPDEEATPPSKKTFTIPNGSVGVMLVLLNIPLHGDQSRARNRMVRIFDARREWMLQQQTGLQQKYAEKDKKGKFVKPPEGQRTPDGRPMEYVVSPENEELASKEFVALCESPFEIELDQQNRKDLVVLRPLILESRVALDTSRGIDYDLICTAFESI